MNSPTETTITIRIPTRTKDKLKALAKKQDLTLSQLIRKRMEGVHQKAGQ